MSNQLFVICGRRNDLTNRRDIQPSSCKRRGEHNSEKLGDAGYARAQVRAVPEVNNETQTVDVTLVVTPGPLVYVRRVEFGNTDTSDVVLREIPQRSLSQLGGRY